MFEAVENVLRFISGKNPNFPRALLANIQSVNREYSSKITRRGGLLRQLAGAFEVFQAPGGAFALTFSTRARVPIIARLTSPCGRTASKLFILRIRTSLNRKRREIYIHLARATHVIGRYAQAAAPGHSTSASLIPWIGTRTKESRSSACLLRLKAERATMPGDDDCAGNRQTLSGSTTHLLGRKERVENLVRMFRRNPASVVADGDFRSWNAVLLLQLLQLCTLRFRRGKYGRVSCPVRLCIA
jgi:hypothetical protein